MKTTLKLSIITFALTITYCITNGQTISGHRLTRNILNFKIDNTNYYKSIIYSTQPTNLKYKPNLTSLSNVNYGIDNFHDYSQYSRLRKYFKDNNSLTSKTYNTSSSSGGGDLLNTMIVGALFFGVAPWAIGELSGSDNYSFGTWVAIGAGIGLVYYIIATFKSNTDSHSFKNLQNGNLIVFKIHKDYKVRIKCV